ncbi:transcription factor DIVARICATA-like isoform X1 [Diospyros lotus]|uniref:transcription factor DIVARICATA-like isoform X1 n=1 Tax=Diospyros lotus TaxID=55363 RepID=UPI0022538DB9|nr:transcription factor DIVARICATA-like isoform X1 [Diospyros lotus]
MVVSGACSASRWTWTRDEDKVFEQALLVVPEGLPDRWHQIAGYLPGKTPEAVLEHYQRLIHDLNDIESGRIEPPGYSDCFQIPRWTRAKCEAEKKKGIPWTKREHELFLIGLQRYGKGDWRSISRNLVQSKTPTQVASHAQKYYLRQSSTKKERKRASIHDITTSVAETVPVPAVQTVPPQFPNGGEGSMGCQNFNHPA